MRAGRVAAVLRSGCGAAVVAQESAQPGHHRHWSVTIAERGIAGRWPKVETAVGPSPVVVFDVLLQDAAAVAVVQDQQPVQRLAASGGDSALGDRVRPGTPRWRAPDFGPLGCEPGVAIADQKARPDVTTSEAGHPGMVQQRGRHARKAISSAPSGAMRSSPVATATTIPNSCASLMTSASSRLLPMPGEPSIGTGVRCCSGRAPYEVAGW